MWAYFHDAPQCINSVHRTCSERGTGRQAGLLFLFDYLPFARTQGETQGGHAELIYIRLPLAETRMLSHVQPSVSPFPTSWSWGWFLNTNLPNRGDEKRASSRRSRSSSCERGCCGTHRTAMGPNARLADVDRHGLSVSFGNAPHPLQQAATRSRCDALSGSSDAVFLPPLSRNGNSS